MTDKQHEKLTEDLAKSLREAVERLEAGEPPEGGRTESVIKRAKKVLDRADLFGF